MLPPPADGRDVPEEQRVEDEERGFAVTAELRAALGAPVPAPGPACRVGPGLPGDGNTEGTTRVVVRLMGDIPKPTLICAIWTLGTQKKKAWSCLIESFTVKWMGAAGSAGCAAAASEMGGRAARARMPGKSESANWFRNARKDTYASWKNMIQEHQNNQHTLQCGSERHANLRQRTDSETREGSTPLKIPSADRSADAKMRLYWKMCLICMSNKYLEEKCDKLSP